MLPPILLLSALLSSMHAPHAATPWLEANHFADLQVVLAAGAPENDPLAATEFIAYWKQCTGKDLVSGAMPGAGFNVWIGRQGVPQDLISQVKLEGIGADGLCIKTVSPRDLLIVGGARGTLFGVYEFLEQCLGVRWLAPGVTHIPETPPAALPEMDYRFVPPFEYRYSTCLNAEPGIKEFRRAQRWVEGPGFSAHTAYSLVSPNEYFAAHPEYFSEVNGRRIAPQGIDWNDAATLHEHGEQRGQLCMTNPGLIQLLTDKIAERIASNAAEKMHHISQMDWQNYCQCAACSAIDAEEESHMGSTLWGLNRVAENIGKRYPGYGIETLAYQYTRKPPKHLKPRPNLAIKLCSIECDFGRALDAPDSVLNRAFARDIETWERASTRLHIWDYTTNFRNFQAPHPNLHVLQPNLQFFARHGVRGIYEQGAYDHGAELVHLRTYLLSKLMWNPDADADVITKEFLTLYYREGAPFIEEYIHLTHETAARKNAAIGCFQEGFWMDAPMAAAGEDIFQRAFAAVNSEETRARLDLAYLPVQYAALACPPKIEARDGKLILSRPPSLSLDAYVARLREAGVRYIVDFFPFDHIYRQMDGETPARHAESTLAVLENDRALLWIAPEFNGAVLRWRDKATGAEMLRGYEFYGMLPTVWREYHHGEKGGAIAPRMEVLARSGTSVTLQTVLENGLIVQKGLALGGEPGEIELTLSCTNPTAAPLVPGFKSVPEFHTQTEATPEIWTQAGGEWTQRNVTGELAHLAMLSPDRYTQLAARFPDAGITLVSVFDPVQAQPLLYAYRAEAPHKQLNLDVVPNQAPLAPGERRTATVRYRITRDLPAQID
ncbi:MAG: DUF4838 domain-containing protein [Candidatus Hydrogenedentes bacterium]|nr:DUF4838 domain-containing protein [Candidatus Hydrogenedentota bacterium]